MDIDNKNNITEEGLKCAAKHLGCKAGDLEILGVKGGYSLNRRSIVGFNGDWIFVKEVDTSILPSDGKEELQWQKKDYDCANLLKHLLPEIVPEWEQIHNDGHVLIMPAFRKEDGWIWNPPSNELELNKYIQTVIDANDNLEKLKIDKLTINNLNLEPYLRDELALDSGLTLAINNHEIRNELIEKYKNMSKNMSHKKLFPQTNKMIEFLHNDDALKDLANKASSIINQPNECLGHSDVRSDNMAYNTRTGQLKIIDWNWASITPKGFGITEFIVDISRLGLDVNKWIDKLNIEFLAAFVSFNLRTCLKDPLSPESKLRELQAQSAAVSLYLYEKALNK